MVVDVLSRIQFGLSIGFHIIFPTLNLGLACFLVAMEFLWLKTNNPTYLAICKFWTKIFALTFGMGVVSGIVLAYQIGTNFGPFIAKFGNVLGALFAYETLTAFFLEAGFLGVMLFGWNKVSPAIHFTATLLVTVGTTISAFWIMSANSWMQTPSGFNLINGVYVVSNWWSVVFNPSFITRYIHMVLASYVTTCFVVAAV
jgi:cytochrome d ubiquinol oxidase subunit I